MAALFLTLLLAFLAIGCSPSPSPASEQEVDLGPIGYNEYSTRRDDCYNHAWTPDERAGCVRLFNEMPDGFADEPIIIRQTITPRPFAAPQVSPTEHHYLARYQWGTLPGLPDLTLWDCPGFDCTGRLDLRSIPQASQRGGAPLGYGWFTYEGPRDICPVGCATQGVLASRDGDTLENAGALSLNLGFPLSATNVNDALAEILTQQGDPTGATAWKPLLSDRIILGGVERWRTEAIWYAEEADPTWRSLAAQVHQADYERIKAENIASGSDQYLRMADFWIETYGFDPRTTEQQRDGRLPHQTRIVEPFSGTSIANFTNVDPSGSAVFSESGGALHRTDTDAVAFPASARHDTLLSSDDQFAQLVQVTQPSNDVAFFAPAVRFSASAETFYWYLTRENSIPNNLIKTVAGTNTNVQTGTRAQAWPQTPRIVVTGSSLEAFVDDILVQTGTDTTITGNLQVGIAAHNTVDDAAHGTGDDFFAGERSFGTAHRVHIVWF